MNENVKIIKKKKIYFIYIIIFFMINSIFFALIKLFIKNNFTNFYSNYSLTIDSILRYIFTPLFEFLFLIIILKITKNIRIINIKSNLITLKNYFKDFNNIMFIVLNIIMFFFLINIYICILNNFKIFDSLEKYMIEISKLFLELKKLNILFLSLLILAANEEIIFRYFLFTYNLKKFKILKAIIFTSLLFAFFHPFNIFTSFLISIVFCIILFKSKNIYIIIFLHFIINFYIFNFSLDNNIFINFFNNFNNYILIIIFLILYSTLIYFNLKYLKE